MGPFPRAPAMTTNPQPQLSGRESDWKGATLLPAASAACILSSGEGQGSACSLRACLTPNKPRCCSLIHLPRQLHWESSLQGAMLNFSAEHPPGFFNPLSGTLSNGESSSQSTHLFLDSAACVSAFPSDTFIYHTSPLPVLPLQFPGESQ